MSRPKEGDRAPEFEASWTGEGVFKLADRRGSWTILAFYPGDFTTVCTRQFCNYRDGREELDGLDAEVIGISPQDVDSHEKFIAKYSLTVPLVEDTDKAIADAYGALGPGGYVRRSIFVIDPEGVIRHRKLSLLGATYEKVGDLREALASARAGA